MANEVNAISAINLYDKETAQTKFDDEKKLKLNSVFGEHIAYMPIGGIGSLLNGSNNDVGQTAVQA